MYCPATATPSLNRGMETTRVVNIPASGMERAEWYATNGYPPMAVGSICHSGMSGGQSGLPCPLTGKPDECCFSTAYNRGVQGTLRDKSVSDVTQFSRYWVGYPDPATKIGADALHTYQAQVTASRGFEDGDKEVYVSSDAATLWA